MPTVAQLDNPHSKEEPTSPPTRRIIRRRRRGTAQKQKQIEPAETIKDDREPQIGFFAHFHIMRILGWNTLLIALGCIGAMAYG